MKSLLWWSAPLALSAFLLAGCEDVTAPGGGGARPGEEADREQSTFKLSLPDVSVAQGESAEGTISIDAGEEFDQPVMVTLTAPQGVMISPQQFELSKDKVERTVSFQADAAAAKGEHTVEVVGKPATGAQTSGEITLTVEEADDEGADAPIAPPNGDVERPLEPPPPGPAPLPEGDADDIR